MVPQIIQAISGIVSLLAPWLGLVAAWVVIKRVWRMLRAFVLRPPDLGAELPPLFRRKVVRARAQGLAWSYFLRHPDEMPADMRALLSAALGEYGLTMDQVLADRRKARRTSARARRVAAPGPRFSSRPRSRGPSSRRRIRPQPLYREMSMQAVEGVSPLRFRTSGVPLLVRMRVRRRKASPSRGRPASSSRVSAPISPRPPSAPPPPPDDAALDALDDLRPAPPPQKKE